MKTPAFKNPHTFDLSNYYLGTTFVLGGRDFDQEEKAPAPKVPAVSNVKKAPAKLDWSFLHHPSKKKSSR